MNALVTLIDVIFTIYIWLLIASAIVSWLVSFKVINTQNKFVYTVMNFLWRVTEPALRPIRRIMPNLGGIDLSPIILILALFFIRQLLTDNLR
ncbi:MAG: YggT family protein [Rhodospirillales bacterium]